MSIHKTLSAFFIGAMLVGVLAACGGGGGGGSTGGGGGGGGGLPPTPTPEPSAAVSGTVVDEAANTPLSGVQVSLAAWTADASPAPIATTNTNGVFSFSVAPGSYLLVIGSNSPSDTRATLHMGVVLNSGNNALTLPTPSSYADVTYTTAQSSGALRLMELSSVQQDCVTGANAGRTDDSLPLLVPDEFLEEDAIADVQEEVAQTTDTPSPLFSDTQPFDEPNGGVGNVSGGTTEAGFYPCDSWTGPSYSYVSGNPPYTNATNASNVWYGADLQIVGDYPTDYSTYGSQLWNENTQGVGSASSSHRAPTGAVGHSERVP